MIRYIIIWSDGTHDIAESEREVNHIFSTVASAAVRFAKLVKIESETPIKITTPFVTTK